MPSFDDECGEFLALYQALIDDVARVDHEVDSPLKRRTFVRTVFAFIEGTTHRFKLLALSFAKDRKVRLSANEAGALTGETFRVSESGKICPRSLHISTVPNLQLTMRLAACLPLQ
jgi:hypothetical protein